jgi:hypothetical protein
MSFRCVYLVNIRLDARFEYENVSMLDSEFQSIARAPKESQMFRVTYYASIYSLLLSIAISMLLRL